MSRIPRPSPALIVAIVALVAACTGGALAAAPHGHAAKSTKLSSAEKSAIKKYAKSYVAKLHPPAGAAGATGARGATGPTGPIGPSSAIEADESGLPSSGSFTSATEHQVVGNFNLPAGAYALTAKVNLALNAAGPGHGVCHLQAGSDTDTAYFWDMNYNGLIPQVYTFNMSVVHVFAATSNAVVKCQVNGALWSSVSATLTAVQLGAASHVAGD